MHIRFTCPVIEHVQNLAADQRKLASRNHGERQTVGQSGQAIRYILRNRFFRPGERAVEIKSNRLRVGRYGIQIEFSPRADSTRSHDSSLYIRIE